MQFDFFLSHNRKQKNFARQLFKILKENQFQVFFDEDSIKPGDNFIKQIGVSLSSSRIVLLICSEDSLKSKWVAMEAAVAINQDPSNDDCKIIPILLDEIDLRKTEYPSLANIHAVKLFNPKTRDLEFSKFLDFIGCTISKTQKINWDKPEENKLLISSKDEVLKWGWDGIKLLQELISLDYQCIEELNEFHEGNPEQWCNVFMDHPETWKLITNQSSEIIGYWHFVPLFEDDFKLSVCGKLIDSEITNDRIKLFELPGEYCIYIVTVCIHPNYQNIASKRTLFQSLVVTIQQLAEQQIFIKEISANAYTNSGVSLCKSFNFNRITNHCEKGVVYHIKMEDLLKENLFQENEFLISLYQNR